MLALATDLQAGLGRGRAREGLTMARGREQLRGRPPKLDQRQEHHIVGLYQTGDYTVREVGDLFNVSRSTVYRAVRRADRAPEMQPRLRNRLLFLKKRPAAGGTSVGTSVARQAVPEGLPC